MALRVQKYGGSSLADSVRIKHVADRIAEAHALGDQVVVVVSAMGDTTDHLTELARELTETPDPREMDLLLSTGELVSCTLLAMALREKGIEAVSLGGGQAGIYTDTVYGKASITSVDSARIENELQEGRIVIVAGFQGVNEWSDVTTLGRGGSDTTAVSLAAALRANQCEIFTDVDGIFTADPRIAEEARKLDEIGYDEMLELASHGAKMHPRSIELGAWYKVPILVTSSLHKVSGTLIHDGVHMEIKNKVRGVTYQKGIARISVRGVPDKPGIAATLFGPLSEAQISVDTIVQNASMDRLTDVSFTVSQGDAQRALDVASEVTQAIGARECSCDENLGDVSIVGTGMENAPGYAALMFKSLSDVGINIEMITTSQIRITCIIDESKVGDAVSVLHKAFDLDG